MVEGKAMSGYNRNNIYIEKYRFTDLEILSADHNYLIMDASGEFDV